MNRAPSSRSFWIRSLATAACAVLPATAVLAQPAGPPGGVPVTTAVASRRDVPIILRNIGTVQAFQSVLVRARVDGTLDKILFEEGQDVKPGDLLAQIDPRPYAATLAQAQAKRAADAAQLANAQRDLARYSSLMRNDFASRQQVDTQTSNVAQMTAALQGDDATIAMAQLNLGFTRITSPIEGRVGLRQVDAGNLIHANDTAGLVTITQLHPISVLFTLPQDNLPAIQGAMGQSGAIQAKPGQAGAATGAAAQVKLPVRAFTADDKTELSLGSLATTDNTIDAATGTIKLKAVFDNPDNKLWPGQFVNARLQIGVRTNALTVPSNAIQHGPSTLYVYVVKPDSTVAVQPVDVIQDDSRNAVIGKGLEDNAQVVVNGQSRLQNGSKVAPTPFKASS